MHSHPPPTEQDRVILEKIRDHLEYAIATIEQHTNESYAAERAEADLHVAWRRVWRSLDHKDLQAVEGGAAYRLMRAQGLLRSAALRSEVGPWAVELAEMLYGVAHALQRYEDPATQDPDWFGMSAEFSLDFVVPPVLTRKLFGDKSWLLGIP